MIASCSRARNFSTPHRSRNPQTRVRQTLKGEAAKYPRLAERAAALADFRLCSPRFAAPFCPMAKSATTLRRTAAHSRRHSATRATIQKSLERILRARGEPAGEDYVTLRNDRFVIPVRAADRRAVGRGARRQRHGPNRFRRAARNHRAE